MSDEKKPTPPASGGGGSPAACTTGTCPEEDKVDIRIVDDGGNPAIATPVVKTVLEISNRVTTADLPSSFAAASPDRDNFKIDVMDRKYSGDTIPAAKVEIEVLKPDGASFSPKRMFNAELKKVAGTDWFRSKYLRLVVDDQDQSANPAQTILTDWDPANPDVEILGQKINVTYISASGKKVTAVAEVGKNRTWINVAVHVMRKTPGNDGSAVVTKDQATKRIQKWFRRVYAQIGMAPRMVQATRLIDPMENLIAISDDNGADAAGGGPNGIKFKIRVKTTGAADKVVNIGPHKPAAGDSAKKTADAVASLINAEPSHAVSARTVQNPPTLEATITKGSADIIITDPAGGRVSIEGLTADDPAQTVKVGRVTATGLIGWAAGTPTPLNWVAGSIQQRTVLQNFDTGKDRVDLVCIDTFSSGDRGQAMMPGTIYAAGKQAIDQITMSAFVAAVGMNGSDNNPFSCPHEAGHDLVDAIHSTDNTQLMKGPTSGTNAVDGTKRFSETAITFDTPSSPAIVQETTIRSKASSVLTNF